MANNLFLNGSQWVKADFHLHTRADKEHKYEGVDGEYVSEYIDRLKQKDIKIGVITNHNKFDRDEYKKLRKKARQLDIFLLPGVELSVNDGANGIHTLLVFSDEWIENGQDYINQFLNVAFEGKTPSEYENENGRSSQGLIDTLKKLEGYNRDFFIVFAHVEQNSGLWIEFDGGRLSDFGKSEIIKRRTLGFQKVRTHDLPNRVCRKKVQQWLSDWYPAELEGSDCKTIESVGDCSDCYIKIGDFTFEAVKYALIDYKNRVSNKVPEKKKTSYIKSIHFEGGVLNNKTVNFSSELNTIIGIRGSGKSAIIESLRYVLDIPFGVKSRDIDYKELLINHVLGSGGKTTIVACDRFGEEYEITRILGDLPEVFVKGKLQQGVAVRETILHKPIYFGQKDLSESGDGFEKDLVEKLLGEKLIDIRTKITKKQTELGEKIDVYLRLLDIDEQIQDLNQKKQDAEFRLKKFSEYKIDEKIKKQTDFESDGREIERIIKDVDEYISNLSELIEEHNDSIIEHLDYKSSFNNTFFDQVKDIYKRFVESVAILNNEKLSLETVQKSLKVKEGEYKTIKQSVVDEFAEIRRTIEQELKSKGIEVIKIEEYPQLQSKIDKAETELKELDKQQKQRNTIHDDLLRLTSEINHLWHQEFQLVMSELAIINENNSALKIDAEYKGDKKEFLSYMQSCFRGSKIRESTFSTLVESYSDFISMYKDLESAKAKVNHAPQVFEQYFVDNMKSLLTWQVPNKYIIQYRDKELRHHSLGQRASALILFVLSQKDNDVVIIDQPEDDLDNQTIYEDVIKLVCKIKSETQFIFATHNANFPVLGDAEQIHSCIYEDGTVNITSGSIDSPNMQKEVIDIMEGGEDAFRRRKEIYQVWKPYIA